MDILNFIPLLIWSLIVFIPFNYGRKDDGDGEAAAIIYAVGVLFWLFLGIICSIK